jgi:hypothetical protein
MLDATDTETMSTRTVVRREHERSDKGQKVAIGACDGRTPIVSVRTRDTERTGRMVTVARSRIKSNRSLLTIRQL